MIVLRCTKKAAEGLGALPVAESSASTTSLGDWYVNLIPTAGGGFFLFMSAESLLMVVVPREKSASDVISMFVRRIANILALIGVPHPRIEEELAHFTEIRVARTASRRLLGVMNDFAFHLQLALEESTKDNKLSLSDFESRMAQIPQATLKWESAAKTGLRLLTWNEDIGKV